MRLDLMPMLVVAGLTAIPGLGLLNAPQRVIDGDSVVLTAWGNARLDGIDAPELRGHCAAERELARDARDRLAELLGAGTVQVRWEGTEKYGRPLVRLTVDGRDVAETLIAEGLGRPYAGGRRESWCG